MLKNLCLYVLLVTICVACTIQGQNEKTKKIRKKSNLPIQSKMPLFAITGFGVEKENIAFEELKQAYCDGKVYVLAQIQEKVNTMMTCKNAKTLNKLQDFIPLAKNNILITDIENISNQFKALQIDSIDFFADHKNYPLYLNKTDDLPFDYQNQITKFTLTGVTAITRNMGFAADTHGTDFLIENLLPFVKDADLLHISNEVSISEGCFYKKYDPSYKFCTKKEHFKALIDLGADIIELTGNHNLDYGTEAYRQTYEWYQQQGMKIFGGGLTPAQANTPITVALKDGKKLGFIGFNEYCPNGECADKAMGANRYEPEKARKAIQYLKNTLKADFIIATVQFGEVDAYTPSGTQTPISKDLIDFGADMVYGSQAHQVQQIEFYKGKSIFHGLGNFLFDQVHRIGVRQAFFLQNYFYKGRLIQSVPIFTFMAMNRKPTIATKKEADAIKKVIYSDALLYK